MAVSLKGRAGAKAGVLSGISMLSLHMLHCPASTGRSLQGPPDPLQTQRLVVCVRERGMGREEQKETQRKQTESHYFNESSDITHLYFPFSFQHILENNFAFPASCVKPQTWLCTQRHTPVFLSGSYISCSYHGLSFNPLVQPDELHEPSSADSSWLSSFCFACFIVWASNVPALPSAHTFGFWLMRGLCQKDSICHLKSSMSWSQVVTQIPQTVYRIDHKFLQ